MNIIEETKNARATLQRLVTVVETTYAILCTLCEYQPTTEAKADFVIPKIKRSDSKELVPYQGDDLDLLAMSATSDEYDQNTCRAYFKKIAQLTHPDKIARYSSKLKAQLLERLYEAREEYKNRNLPGLVFCYVDVRFMRGEEHKVDPSLLKILEAEVEAINCQMQYIYKKPYIEAINAYLGKNVKLAIVLFKQYINKIDRTSKIDIYADL